MAAIDLGRLRFYHQGAYSGATTYEINDVVTYGDKSFVYISTTSAAGNLPTNATYWSLMAGGQDYKGTWATSTAYKVDDIVLRGGSAYICLIANTSGTFATDLAAAKWEVFVGGTKWKGNWAASIVYLVNDIVFIDGNAYIATSDHTSTGTFATDLGIPLWALFSQGGTNIIPSQTGNAGKVLKTDGTDVSWTNAVSIVSATLSGALTALSVTSNTSVSTLSLNATSSATIGGLSSNFAATLTNPTLTVQSNTTDYSQIAFRNLGTNANSSTDFIAYSDIGDDDTGWIDMGITSSNFDDPSFTITGPHDGYIFVEGPANTVGNGNLILATGGNGTQNKIIFAAGGLSSDKTQMVITPNTSVAINIATNSTSAVTGALTVVGGVGIGGNVFITGNTSITGTITVGGGAFSSNNLTVSDPIIFMGNTNSGDSLDLGFAGKFNDGAVKYAGLLRDASDSGKFRLFTGLTEVPTSTANFAAASNASLILGGLEASGLANVAGIVTISNTTAASSTTAAALVVTGGIATANNVHVGGALNVTGNTTLSGNLAVTGSTTSGSVTTTKLTATTVIEPSLVSATAATGTIQINFASNPTVYYTTAASGSFSFNVRGSSGVTLDSLLAVGDIATVTFMVTNTGTAYYPSAFTVDTSYTPTIKWQGGTAPTGGNANSIDLYTYSLIKTATNTYTAFASQTKFA